MKTVFQISGMTCSACERVVAGRLRRIAGVKNATVQRNTQRAEVEAESVLTKDQASQALKDTHYRGVSIL